MNVIRSFTTWHYRILAACWTLGMIAVMSVPGARLPGIDPSLGVDKAVHFALFAGFGVLWMRALRPRPVRVVSTSVRARGIALFVSGCLFAGCTEVYQYFMPIHRMADPYDFLADALGLAVGVALYCIRRKRKVERV